MWVQLPFNVYNIKKKKVLNFGLRNEQMLLFAAVLTFIVRPTIINPNTVRKILWCSTKWCWMQFAFFFFAIFAFFWMQSSSAILKRIKFGLLVWKFLEHLFLFTAESGLKSDDLSLSFLKQQVLCRPPILNCSAIFVIPKFVVHAKLTSVQVTKHPHSFLMDWKR